MLFCVRLCRIFLMIFSLSDYPLQRSPSVVLICDRSYCIQLFFFNLQHHSPQIQSSTRLYSYSTLLQSMNVFLALSLENYSFFQKYVDKVLIVLPLSFLYSSFLADTTFQMSPLYDLSYIFAESHLHCFTCLSLSILGAIIDPFLSSPRIFLLLFVLVIQFLDICTYRVF